MKRSLYVLLLGAVLLGASCKKSDNAEEPAPARYKVKTSGSNKYLYDANGLMVKAVSDTDWRPQTRMLTWSEHTLVQECTSEGQRFGAGTFQRNSQGYVLSSPADYITWSYDEKNHLIETRQNDRIESKVTTYTWTNDNMVMEKTVTTYYGNSHVDYTTYTYSDEADTRDLGMKYYPYAQLTWYESKLFGSKNLITQSTRVMEGVQTIFSTYAYAKDSKGRITGVTETAENNNGYKVISKQHYSYSD